TPRLSCPTSVVRFEPHQGRTPPHACLTGPDEVHSRVENPADDLADPLEHPLYGAGDALTDSVRGARAATPPAAAPGCIRGGRRGRADTVPLHVGNHGDPRHVLTGPERLTAQGAAP